jgi:hypothetical protein
MRVPISMRVFSRVVFGKSSAGSTIPPRNGVLGVLTVILQRPDIGAWRAATDSDDHYVYAIALS